MKVTVYISGLSARLTCLDDPHYPDDERMTKDAELNREVLEMYRGRRCIPRGKGCRYEMHGTLGACWYLVEALQDNAQAFLTGTDCAHARREARAAQRDAARITKQLVALGAVA